MKEELRAPDRPSESKAWRKEKSHLNVHPPLNNNIGHRRARSQDEVVLAAPQPYAARDLSPQPHFQQAPSQMSGIIPKFDFRALIFQQHRVI
jgi:hypothetical protein